MKSPLATKTKRTKRIVLPKGPGHFSGFAMIVDINGYAKMVRSDETGTAAQDTRDALSGPIAAVEKHGGEVVAFMGDAFLAVLETNEAVVQCCFSIAKDVDRTNEWIASAQQQSPGTWPHMPGGIFLKVTVEFGRIDASTINSRFLGKQMLLCGEAINYAARIGRYGVGNRCLFGPRAAASIGETYELTGPFKVAGKDGEGDYHCYKLDLGEIWKEGPPRADDSYWG